MLKTNTAIGKDLTFADLRRQGFNAVLIAIGLAQSRSLGIPGIDSKGILLAIPFLKMAAEGVRVKLGDHAVVIGGGNVAIDVARTALRMGAEKSDHGLARIAPGDAGLGLGNQGSAG